MAYFYIFEVNVGKQSISMDSMGNIPETIQHPFLFQSCETLDFRLQSNEVEFDALITGICNHEPMLTPLKTNEYQWLEVAR